MVCPKSELFEKELRENAELFKVLGHPARLQILIYLAQSEKCISGDISNELPLGRTTVNQHIKELKKIGLIKGVTEGVHRRYCLNPEKIKELKWRLGQFLGEIEISNYKCK